MPILLEVAAVVLAHAVGTWLITYLLHSTVLHLLARAVERLRDDPALHAVAWRTALLAPLFTASLHTALPFGSSLRMSAATAGAVLGPRPVLALLVVVLWCVLIAVRLIAVARGEWRARAALGERHCCTDARLQEMLASHALAAGVRRTPKLTTSHRISSPAALAPGEVCIPAGIFDQLQPAEQHALFAHELAHHARRDPLWCGTAAIVAAVCCFQPLNHRAVRRLLRACEYAADARAVRVTANPLALARALAALAPYVLHQPQPRAAAAGSPLFERVRRILDETAPQHRSSRRRAVMLAGALIGVCLAIGPGVNFTVHNAANSIPALTPSRNEPSPQMLALRRVQRDVLAAERSIMRR
ncbi:MAG TPA: M56 family metallopeptidase [Longimicrobiales bacterium]|nr:M56 family metallopeptidase [Longimicrobiales bacterium]